MKSFILLNRYCRSIYLALVEHTRSTLVPQIVEGPVYVHPNGKKLRPLVCVWVTVLDVFIALVSLYKCCLHLD